MSENALEAARREKRKLQNELARTLTDFTDRTGLVVDVISLDRIEVTEFGDSTAKYQYAANCEITVSD